MRTRLIYLPRYLQLDVLPALKSSCQNWLHHLLPNPKSQYFYCVYLIIYLVTPNTAKPTPSTFLPSLPLQQFNHQFVSILFSKVLLNLSTSDSGHHCPWPGRLPCSVNLSLCIWAYLSHRPHLYSSLILQQEWSLKRASLITVVHLTKSSVVPQCPKIY